MAKVVVEFDTKTKDMVVKFDGKAVDNVYSVSLSKSYYATEENENPFSMSLMTLDDTNQKEDGYRSMQQIVARDTTEGAEALKNGAGTHPSHPNLLLLTKPNDKIVEGISNILASRRGRY